MRRSIAAVACLITTSCAGSAPGTETAVAPQAADAPQPATPIVIGVGQYAQGALEPGDEVASDGSFTDGVFVNAMTQSITIALSSPSHSQLRAMVNAPNGQPLTQSANGIFVLPPGGIYRVQVIGAQAGATAQWVLGASANDGQQVAGTVQSNYHAVAQTNNNQPSPAAQPLTLGTSVSGALVDSDSALASGERADEFAFQGTAGQTVTFQLTSSAFDTFLIVQSPDGQRFQNDDANGTRNSALTMTLPANGTYRVVATSYRPTERGDYQITAGAGVRELQQNNPDTPTASSGVGGTQTGALGPGDQTLQTGEFTDWYEYNLAAGTHLQVRMNSSEFDTYLLVRGPNGAQADNDDITPEDRNSGVDMDITTAGTYRVGATSYRPGEQGHYTLTVNGPATGSTPSNNGNNNTRPAQNNGAGQNLAVGGSVRGQLQQGDSQLPSGEFADAHPITLPAGSSVRLRLASTQFDPYIVVRTPSGRQLDNDDFTPNTRDSGIDIPAAEAGVYNVTVTSYRPGEQGNYTLTLEQGPTIARPIDNNGNRGNASQGGRVFGVFAGITDYPGGISDLPGCAEDARKMAQTFTQVGLMDESRYALFTDSQATRDNVREAMRRFAAQAGPQDVFVFFYSGHGSRGAPGSSQDQNEVDGADESIVLYDGQLIDDEMGQLFDGIHAQTAILALDSCFAGGFAKDVIRRPGRVGYFSSEEDVTSAVAGQFQAGGYLAHFFKVGIEGAADADPGDNVLTVGELSHYLHRQFAQHASDVRMGVAYQNLVVDRGAVSSDVVLWAFRH